MKIYKTEKQILKQIEKINYDYITKTKDTSGFLHYEGDDSFYIDIQGKNELCNYISFAIEPMQMFFENDERGELFWICAESYFFYIQIDTGKIMLGINQGSSSFNSEFKKELTKLFYNDLKKYSL